MTLSEITMAMQTYADQRNTAGVTTMQGWYNNRNSFPYTRDNQNPADAYIHAYPGIVSGELVFFVISAYNDVSTNNNIANDVQICATTWLDPATNNSENTSNEYNYVQYWINNYNSWIANNITTIFQGFQIPQADSSFGTVHNALLALKTNSGATGVAADVVVQDVDGRTIEYFDTAYPVPPFDATGMSETDFYLYTLLT